MPKRPEPVQAPTHGSIRVTANQLELLARLMLYLHCVTSCIASKILDDYITNYRQHASLTTLQSRNVLEMAQKFRPKELIGKIIVQAEANVDGHVRYSKRIPPGAGEVYLLDRKVEVTQALFCTPAWLDHHYEQPMEQLPEIIFGTRHCSHCLGAGNACACFECQRFSWSHCTQADAPLVQGSIAPPSSTQLPHHDKYSQELHETRSSSDVGGKQALPFPSASKGSSPRNGAPQEAEPVQRSDIRPKKSRKPAAQDAPPSREKRSDLEDASRSLTSAGVPVNAAIPVTSPGMSAKEHPAVGIPKKPEHPPHGDLVVQQYTVDVEQDGNSPRSSSDKQTHEDAVEDDEIQRESGKTSKMTNFLAKKKEWGLLGRLLRTPPNRAKAANPSSEKPTEQIDLNPDDCVILVMGPTGAGKSTFISKAMGIDVGIGDSLASCTSTINTFRLPPPVKGSPLACLGSAKVVLVDTPGFDDTNKPDYEIFEMVAKWLKNVSLSSLGIAGLIYLHRISDNRMAGTPLKNLNMFRELCGKKIMTNVTLMTTMWADTMEEDAVRRERELAGKYFKEFLRLGATLARFEDDQASAARILEPPVNTWGNTQAEDQILSMVRLQKEVTTYHLDIAETSAARVVHGKVQAILERRQELLDKLANQIEANKDDPELIQEITGEMTRLQVELEEAQRDADRLHLEFASHLKMFMTKVIRHTHPLINTAQRMTSLPRESSRRVAEEPERIEASHEDQQLPATGSDVLHLSGKNPKPQDVAQANLILPSEGTLAGPGIVSQPDATIPTEVVTQKNKPPRQQSSETMTQKFALPGGKFPSWRPKFMAKA